MSLKMAFIRRIASLINWLRSSHLSTLFHPVAGTENSARAEFSVPQCLQNVGFTPLPQ